MEVAALLGDSELIDSLALRNHRGSNVIAQDHQTEINHCMRVEVGERGDGTWVLRRRVGVAYPDAASWVAREGLRMWL